VGLTYQELMDGTGLPRTTVYDRLKILETDMIVERRSVKRVEGIKRYTEWWLTLDGRVLKLEDLKDAALGNREKISLEVKR